MSDEITPTISERGAPMRPGKNGGKLQSGNPGNRGGGGKGSISYWINVELSAEEGKEARAVAKALIREAKAGNGALAKELLNRNDGPVTEHVAHDGKITFEVVHVYEGDGSADDLDIDEDDESEEVEELGDLPD
jgi:hypothetical protein